MSRDGVEFPPCHADEGDLWTLLQDDAQQDELVARIAALTAAKAVSYRQSDTGMLRTDFDMLLNRRPSFRTPALMH